MRAGSDERYPTMGHRSRLLESRARHPTMRSWNGNRPRDRGGYGRPRWMRVVVIVLIGGSVGGLAAIAVDDPIRLRISGVAEGQVLAKSEIELLAIEVHASGIGATNVSVKLNGVPVDVERIDGVLVGRPASLVKDGENYLEVRVNGRFVFADYLMDRRFTAVLTSPVLDVPAQTIRPSDGGGVVIRGLVDDAIRLEVNGRAIPINGGGFAVELSANEQAVVVRAVHANGNTTERVVSVVDTVSPAKYPDTRAVHISAEDWADAGVRGAILALAAEGSINAVQLDIKNEAGEIGYLSAVQMAAMAGSSRPHYDPKVAIAELHGMDVRVIGRIVCFLDPIVADWAWRSGRSDMLVLSADGSRPLDNNYGDAVFTNFASPDVQRYLIDLSVEAATAGFDEILYDYVRRPEGDTDSMVVPGLARPTEVEIARFVRETKAALDPLAVELGVSVFGIAASRPTEIGQDIRLLAPHVDYVAPMVYPSHWGPGEYGVPDPLRQPAEIVGRSLADFYTVVAGSEAAIVPWLQAFSASGVDYGPAEVQAQIDAAMATGSSGFLLWNANSLYDPMALAGTP